MPWRLRVRAYAVATALTFLSVPFAHLYLRVELGADELALHAADITLGTLAGVVLFEGVVSLAGRRVDWVLDRRTMLVAALAAAIALAVAVLWRVPRDLLPGMDVVRAKHVASGYGDMTLRILPIVPLIAYLSFAASRQAALREELAALRTLNAALLARSHDAAHAPARPAQVEALRLGHEGGEVAVDPARLVRVQAQENYCELVLEPPAGGAHPLVRSTLAEVEARLPPGEFVRTHRSHLVRLDAIGELCRAGRRASLTLRNGDAVPIARARSADVQRALEAFVASRSDRGERSEWSERSDRSERSDA